VAASAAIAQSDKPVLLQKPTVNRTHIVFSHAGHLWSVPREGGEARQLTNGPGTETNPYFSPDGSLVAFTGEYEGNVDVYVTPLTGGNPRRLSWHPGADIVRGWTPDGKKVLFRSDRNSYSRFGRLFTIPIDGSGLPEELPLPMAEEGSYSADAARIAYMPLARAFESWKRYRGGRTSPIWIANLSDSRIERIPRNNSNDFAPMWVGDQVYFLSDRNGPITLMTYDTRTKRVTSLVQNAGLDIKSASAGPGAIVYEQFGTIYLFDLKSRKSKNVDIQIAADLPATRPSFEKVARSVENASLSPSGVRAIFEARGEILTVPAEKGDIRDLTNTPGVAERYPSWSPDGKRIAYFSDESGEYELHLRAQDGMGDVTKIKLPPGFYYEPLWSPDSKKIAFTDHAVNVWYLELEKGSPVKVDTDGYLDPGRPLNPSWSPDSRWLTYTKALKNHLRAVFVYSIETGKTHQITDGMSDTRTAVFDNNGESLYFMASTDAGPTSGWLDMSSINRPVTSSVYVVVLRKDLKSPLAPESDEEKGETAKESAQKPGESKEDDAKAKEKKEPAPISIDFDGISQRTLAMPLPARRYARLVPGKAGVLFVEEAPVVNVAVPEGGGTTIHKFDFKTRKTEKMLEGTREFCVSFNGEKLLYRKGDRWAIAGTDKPPKPGNGPSSAAQPANSDEKVLKMDAMEVRVDPRAEWRQMYRDVWRIERDFFYDPNFHGVNVKEYSAKYEPYLERLGSRADLSYLFSEMLGELSVGHLYVAGGAMPPVKSVPGGLLGADYRVENGRYRFAHVYDGESWNPQLTAPLTQPGVNVVAGEYLLAVNGRDLRATDNLYSYFEGTADKSVVLRVGPDPSGANSREVTVVPLRNEAGLRNLAWIEDNRRKVEKMSSGKLAYVYLPNTSTGGLTSFNRYYFAQVDKYGAVIDERFNGGGSIADYIIDYMRRPLMNFFTTRYGDDFTTPVGSIFGPKAMIVNEYAGSGGDAMPWLFRKSKIGPLIGKRTWGGLVGIYEIPRVMDGGFITAPDLAFYNTEGQWDVENHGVDPDVEVEFDPALWRAGHDPQLEKTVEVLMNTIEKNPPPVYKRPPYPNYHKGNAANAPRKAQ
ncbi:MAG: PDZ domain-containing protein, partial [Bryobacteraceae bacterium]